MTENAKMVVNFMRENYGVDFTAQEVAKELNIPVSAVTITVTNLIKKGLAFRNSVAAHDAEGKEIVVKHIGMTEAGRDFDFEADEAAKAAAKAAKKAKKAEKVEE